MRTKRIKQIALPLAGLVLSSPSVAFAQDGNDAAKIVNFLKPGGIVIALVAIAIAIVALRVIDSVASRFSDRFSDRRLLAQQTNTILRFIIYMVTIVVAISSVITLEKEALLALSGVIAVTVGFALKDLASSVLAGITILFDRPFQVGDRVTVAGFYGEIQNIGLRSVRMITLDDSVVTIPNNRFLTEVVVSGNAGALDMQIVMDFFIAPDSDLASAKRVVYEALRTSRFVFLDKPVVVLVKDLMEANYFATRLRAKAYVLDVRYEKEFETDVTMRVKQAFQERSIQPPSVIYSPGHNVDANHLMA
jgi:small-conductance mechanosensitive channel